MLKYMKYVWVTIKYFRPVVQMVLAAEAAYGAGSGTEKKRAVLTAIEAAAHEGEESGDAVIQAVSTLVDNIVHVFNASGLFEKATPTEPEPTQ